MRTLTNTANPIGPPGTPMAGSVITFVMVGPDGKTAMPILVESATAHGAVIVNVDASGIFSIALPTTDSTTPESFYAVEVKTPGPEPGEYYANRFVASFPAGIGDLEWADFYLPGTPIEPGEWSAFFAHLLDDDRHLTAADRAAISDIVPIKLIAGGTIGGDKVIAISGGVAVLADYATTLPGAVIGMSTGAAVLGADVNIKRNGQVALSGLTPDAVYFLGSSGGLSVTPPPAGLVQRIGVADTSTRLTLTLGEPYLAA